MFNTQNTKKANKYIQVRKNLAKLCNNAENYIYQKIFDKNYKTPNQYK